MTLTEGVPPAKGPIPADGENNVDPLASLLAREHPLPEVSRDD